LNASCISEEKAEQRNEQTFPALITWMFQEEPSQPRS